MPLTEAMMFPISFAGALIGIIGMILAPDGVTGEVAGLLFLACAMIFGVLVVWYPTGGTPER